MQVNCQRIGSTERHAQFIGKIFQDLSAY